MRNEASQCLAFLLFLSRLSLPARPIKRLCPGSHLEALGQNIGIADEFWLGTRLVSLDAGEPPRNPNNPPYLVGFLVHGLGAEVIVEQLDTWTAGSPGRGERDVDVVRDGGEPRRRGLETIVVKGLVHNIPGDGLGSNQGGTRWGPNRLG